MLLMKCSLHMHHFLPNLVIGSIQEILSQTLHLFLDQPCLSIVLSLEEKLSSFLQFDDLPGRFDPKESLADPVGLFLQVFPVLQLLMLPSIDHLLNLPIVALRELIPS